MVFCSCIDVVEFLFNILSKTTLSASQDRVDASDANVSGHSAGCTSEIFPNALVYGLHGSMADSKRQLTFKQFVAGPKAAVLFCTSVASRGLDMPMLSTVVQYDLPTENGLEEYIHRAGRTARMGQKGEVWSFVAPEEKDWVGWLEARLVSLTAPAGSLSNPKTLWSSPYDEVLQSGFGGDHHRRATQLQLAFERAVVADSLVGNVSLILTTLIPTSDVHARDASVQVTHSCLRHASTRRKAHFSRSEITPRSLGQIIRTS
jgi:ATP-dependent RNA helicase DDX31/DBP7